VAAIAAVDEDVATEALDLIEVEYELLPTISSMQSALEHPEPRVHDSGEFGNVHRRQVYEFGDVEAGFAEADFIREDLTFYEGSTHLALEQHASVATFSHDGKLTLYTCTQDLHTCIRPWSKCWVSRQSHPRDCHAQWRRLWRQVRSLPT